MSSNTGAIGGGTSYSSDNPWSDQIAQEASTPAAASAPAAAAKQGAAEERFDEEDPEEDPCEPFSSDNPQPDQAAQEATNRDGCFSSSGTLDDALPDPAEPAKQDASNDE